MADVASSIVINKPVEEVFDYIIDPSNYASWQDQVVGASVSPAGPVALGSVYTIGTKVMGRTMETQLKVSEFMENSRWAITTIGVPTEVTSVFDFEAAGDGTQLTISMSLPPGAYPAPAAGAVKASMQKQFDANTQKLKKLLEG